MEKTMADQTDKNPKTLDQSKGPGAHAPKTLDQIQKDIEARRVANTQADPKTGNVTQPAPAQNTRQTAEDVKAEQARANNVTTNVVTAEKTAAIQDKVAADRNAANEAGHAVNMKKAEEDAKRAHDNTARNPNPNLGKQRDVNTPVIDPKTGAKHWPA